MNKNLLTINAALAFSAAFLITTIIHEFGHFLAYYVAGLKPVMYNNYVISGIETNSVSIKVGVALAGPIFSLVQGLICAIVVQRSGKNSAAYFITLWLSLTGFVNFFGYLMTTPLSRVGDTGKAAHLLNVPFWVQGIIALLGIAILVVVVVIVGKHLGRFIPATDDAREKNKWVLHILLYPLIAGSVINVLLSLPAPAVLSLVYAGTASFVLMCAFGPILNAPSPENPPRIAHSFSIPIVVIFALSVALRGLLGLGMSWG